MYDSLSAVEVEVKYSMREIMPCLFNAIADLNMDEIGDYIYG